MSKKITIKINYLPSAINENLKEIAKDKNISRNDLILEILKEFVLDNEYSSILNDIKLEKKHTKKILKEMLEILQVQLFRTQEIFNLLKENE